MGHVFRLNNQSVTDNSNTIVDWSNTSSTTYNHGYVDEIAETTTTQREITSIPSPFARIELIKEAFGKVAPTTVAGLSISDVETALHGTSIYHKMVSDTLDVAQLFFSYPSMKDKLDIVVWQRNRDIQSLRASISPAHQTVGKTLDMFLSQDARGNDPYNFGKMQNMYILKYKGPGQRPMHIIGATSPSTLFFSTANDESGISQYLCFGTDYAFDKDYNSLDQRDVAFIKYLFAFRFSNPYFNAHYPEVAKYLDAVYYVLDNALKNEINQIQNSCQNVVAGQKSYVDSNYEALEIQVDENTVYNVEINGINYHCNKPVVAGNSDFEIAATKPVANKPLVLPVVYKPEYSRLTYFGSTFGTNFNVPYNDNAPLSGRKLPGINIQYPYLTISDFLEDKIVMLPHRINSRDYFDGNYSSNNNKEAGFLIPVTDRFFDYFSVNDLMGDTPSGKKMIEIKSLASGVEVKIRIPIQNNNEIEYKRIYNLDVNENRDNNVGAIVLPPPYFAVGVFPPIKFVQEAESHYRIILAGEYNLNKNFSCICYGNGQFFAPDYVVRNTDDETDVRKKVYLIDNKSFDFARIGIKTDKGTVRQGAGLMIPKFKKSQGSASYVFAVDLGTSNTHIEYKDKNKKEQLPTPFEYDIEQPQLSMLFDPRDEVVLTQLRGEFFPEYMGKGSDCNFPMRTVLCVDKNNAGINESGANQYVAFGNVSPAFLYNKEIIGEKYSEFFPNLKWSNDKDNDKRLRSYIECLLLMIRTKVLQLGGSLRQTQIKWFYPISMPPYKKGLFEKTWNSLYNKYFDATITPSAITESIAPYQFFQKTMPNVTDIVTIDIGGGTTDIVVADLNGVKCITSMRFAADAIFGNSLVEVNTGKLNGIIRQFKDRFMTDLIDNGLYDKLGKRFSNLTENGMGNSSEVASFLFSLADNKEVKEKQLEQIINFNDALSADSKQKVVFYIFYTSIIYHLAKLMKCMNLKAPSNIAFSGNGSKVIPLLSSNIPTLEKLTTNIFKLIYTNVDIDKNIKLILNSVNPKEATCKGGIFLGGEPENISSLKQVLLASKLLNGEKYNDVAILFDDVIDEVRQFTDFLFLKLPQRDISLKNDFGIDQKYVRLAIECFNENLKTYLEKGIQLKLNSNDVGYDDQIEETMFFYPIIGVMNDLSNRICDEES